MTNQNPAIDALRAHISGWGQLDQIAAWVLCSRLIVAMSSAPEEITPDQIMAEIRVVGIDVEKGLGVFSAFLSGSLADCATGGGTKSND